ncbi:MAG: hypothetical protein LBM93_14445, partial [Oscillospiraceae bacterium]|nr:hypothetical protein [Oscillospiraceae bacterium]
MFNNISFRDKVIIFVISILILVGLFIFAGYRPLTAEIKELKPQRTTALEAAEALHKQVGDVSDKSGEDERIRYTPSDRNTYKGSDYEHVLDTYKAAKVDAKAFSEQFSITPPDKLTLDDMMKKLLDESGLKVTSITFGETSPTSIQYYANEPNDPWLTKTYELRKSVDTLVGGKISEENAKAFAY